jgi:diketogulonate reductase-like aldo/keto reductase
MRLYPVAAAQIPLINGIPAIGLGTYPLTAAQCIDTVKMAVELGYRHIDTAQMYGNEHEVGRAIAQCGVARKELFVTTKVDPSNLGKARFADSVKKSIHWPPADAELDATIDRLMGEKEKGMARRIGVSNFSSRLLRQAAACLGRDLSCNQVEFQPMLDQHKLKATADELSVPLVAYSPIARGKALEIPAVKAVAERLKRPPSEIVLRWITQQGVIVIPMTTKRENALSNLNIFSFTLTDADMAAISAVGTAQGRTIAPSWMAGRWDA